MHRLAAVALALLLAAPVAAADGPLSKGRMNVGLGANGGSGFFTIGASFGYFVIDRLRPALSVAYTWHSGSGVTSHEVDTDLSLRYYLVDARPIAPFLVIDGGYIHLAYEGAFDDRFDFFSVGGGAGILWAVTRSFGLEVTVGLIDYLGADQLLFDSDVLPEGVSFKWSFGFSVMF